MTLVKPMEEPSRGGLTIKGTVMAGRDGVPAIFVHKLIDFWKEGRLPVEKLIRYYGDRQVLLLEPDARPPRLTAYALPEQPEQVVAPAPSETPPPANGPNKKPLLELEQVR